MENYLEQLKKFTVSFFRNDSVKIILFGSRAKKEHASTSDIDIGIIPSSNVNSKTITLFREKIENLNIPFKIDVVNFNETSEDFRREALKGAIVWKN